MNAGDTVAEKRQVELGPNQAMTVHILQHQPTSRPIEDRYSIDVRVSNATNSEAGDATLLLGVYDGHRGSSAADYVAQALPSEILSTAAQLTDSPDGKEQKSASAIQDKFEAFDRKMLSSFQNAHPPPAKASARTPKRILGSIASKLLKSKTRDESDGEPKINPEYTTAALRVLSGCTASMLMIKLPQNHSGSPSADIINLGDSRVVVASFSPEPTINAASIDVNSSSKDEQSHVVSQHPTDDSKDIFIGGRLFGETLSTRAFGDAMYKLPVHAAARQSAGQPSVYPELTLDQRAQHKHLIHQLSTHQQAAAATKGKKILPLSDRYDALFWAYKSPPYVSATPQVTKVQLSIDVPNRDDSLADKEQPITIAVLATDGLWDLVSSEEAARFLGQALSGETSDSGELNLAQILLDKVIEHTTRKPGDDVTILVLVIPSGSQ